MDIKTMHYELNVDTFKIQRRDLIYNTKRKHVTERGRKLRIFTCKHFRILNCKEYL